MYLATLTALTTATPDRDWGPGGWWPVFPLLWLVFWLVVLGLVVTALRRRGADRSGLAVLAERYARGEIDEEEYTRRAEVLRRHRR